MTVEVAILNSQGIALAADSAVTSGSGSRQKIFHTIKLFTLSKFHPVGIMVYSSADIMGLPIETVIKVFRRRLGKKSFPTLEEYAQEFKCFLLEDDTMLTLEGRTEQCENLLLDFFDDCGYQIDIDLMKRSQGWQGHSVQEVSDTCRKCLTFYRERYKKSPKLAGYTEQKKSDLLTALSSVIANIRRFFQNRYGLTSQQTRFIGEMCVNIIFSIEAATAETGFVVAGFGNEDYLPKLRSFEFQSSIFGVHKIYDGEDVNIVSGEVKILPFAQPDMIDMFVRGRSKAFDQKLFSLINKHFADKIHESQTTGDDQPVKDMMAAAYRGIRDELNRKLQILMAQYTRDEYLVPVESTVNIMPKNELAVMAETLVNLTAIKRRVSREQETVGGPIDVAMISKGDGFVWIKRKHYFDKELNPSFISKYLETESNENV